MNLVKAKTTKRFGGEPYITLPRGAKVGSTVSESNVFKSITYGFKQVPKDINAPTDLVSVEEFKKDAPVKFHSKDEEGVEFPYEFNIYGYNSIHNGNYAFISVIELPDHNDLNLVGTVNLTSRSSGEITIDVCSAPSEEGVLLINEKPNFLYEVYGTWSNGNITTPDVYCAGTIQNPFTPGMDEDSHHLYELFCEFVTMSIQSGTIFPNELDPDIPFS